MQVAINPQTIIAEAEKELAVSFQEVDRIALKNQRKVLDAFRKHRLSEEFFAERTGYGMQDAGRETIDKIFAEVFNAEAAAVRMQFVSGTHALACALLGNLTPGQRMACLTGDPYDTLKEVIGIEGDEPGSLKTLGIDYVQGDVAAFLHDPAQLKQAVAPLVSAPTTLAHIQKSCGYSYGQKTLSSNDIELLARLVHELNPACIVMVDNCYGEFVEEKEPPACGADLTAGSLIKNPGGGLAISGGYIAGKAHLVEAALNRLTAPGIGGHLGLTYNQNRLILQGLFLAPAVVSSAVKGAMLFAQIFTQLGMEVHPPARDPRFDIIQGIKFGDRQRLIAFCRAIQMFSPVNAHVIPEPASMPGYQDEVIMAGGTFIEGATIELSADGPLRPPFAAFLQGGLSYLHVKCAAEGLLESYSAGESAF